jgi:hypothetical protein
MQAVDILDIHPRRLRHWRGRYEADQQRALRSTATAPPPQGGDER